MNLREYKVNEHIKEFEKQCGMIKTTLNRIRAHEPCADGWKKLLTHLGKSEPDDEPLPFSVIVESNGLHDALWCCRAEPQHSREWRLFAVWCARRVEHLMTDQRSRDALTTAERHADGLATDEELAAAYVAAYAASSYAAREASCDARKTAAYASSYAARDAACDAAWDAAYASYASYASYAASRAAGAAYEALAARTAG
jgi:hypothetical protein